MVITLLSDFFHSLGNEASNVHVAVGGDGGDLNDFSGGGNGFGVGREKFEDTVDGGLGTSGKIHGLQPAQNVFTPSEWMARARTVAVGVITRYFVCLLSNILNTAKILGMR
jgi:hypothetical protein